MRYVTQLETPWPPKDAIAVVADGSGYTIYQAGDTLPEVLPGDSTDIVDPGSMHSFEYFGIREGNSSDLNSARLQAALDAAPGNRRWTVQATPGCQYRIGTVRLRQPWVTLSGEATLLQDAGSTIQVGIDQAQFEGLTSRAELHYIIRDLDLQYASPSTTDSHISLAFARIGTIKGVQFRNGSIGVNFLPKNIGPVNGGSVAPSIPHQTSRTRILDCEFFENQWGVYGTNAVGGTVYNLLQHGDVLIRDPYIHLTRGIQNIYARGFDGISIFGGYFFLPTFSLGNTVKKENIYVEDSVQVKIHQAELFEPGYEGVKLYHCSREEVTDNIIWGPGQVKIAPAIAIVGGDAGGGTAARAVVSDNMIYAPTGGGIYVDTASKTALIANNLADGCGNTSNKSTTLAPSDIAIAITGITNANPAVVTAPGHGRRSGDSVVITGVTGMTQVNETALPLRIRVSDSNTFRLETVDSTAYGAYAGGGYASPCYGVNAPGDGIVAVGNTCDTSHNLKLTNMSQARGRSNFGGDEMQDTIRTLTNSTTATTLDCWGFDVINQSPGSAVSVSAITYRNGFDVPEGKELTIVAFNGNTTLVNGAAILLKGGVNAAMPTNGLLRLRYLTGAWREQSRNF